MVIKDQIGSLREKFETDGYCIARNVLDEGLVTEARQHVQWLAERHPDVRPELLGHTLMTKDAFWVRLISDDRLLDIAEQFIGPNIALFASHYIAKPPYDGQPVLWHQDGTYWPLDPMEVVTLWLAVDDSTPENGCLRVLPGTQNSRLMNIDEYEHPDIPNVLDSGISPASLDESKAVDIILKAGDVSIHHPTLIHGSNANNSAKWRRGLTIRYIPSSTRIVTEGQWPSAFLLRGAAVPGVNQYHPWPAYNPEHSMPFKGAEAWPPAGK